MSTCQLSFKAELGSISILENQGFITHLKFHKTNNQRPLLQLLEAKNQIKQC